MMEKAVEVMKQSINEPREDDKASPLVGAVLVKPDGTVDTAFRGELRHGDHAEFTLLERKHGNDPLDGSVAFATLEPCAPVTTAQLQEFTAPMYNRNPKLQFAFGGSKLVEGRGLGMRTLGEATTKHGLPVPTYEFDGLYLNLTIYRHALAALGSLGEGILNKLSKSERAGWKWLASKGRTKSGEYAEGMKLPYRTAMNHLKKFQDLGLLERTGSARATEYKVRKP